MVSWSLAAGGLVPQPLRPPLDNLILWVRGDAGMTLDAPTRLGRWANQHGLNADLTSGDPGTASEPYVLGDNIDGVPLVTFGVGVDANKGLRTGAPNPGAASNLVDALGNPMDGSSARTILVMHRPDFQAAFGRIGGNPLAHSTYGAIFSLWADITPNGAQAWSHAWQSEDVNWGPQTGGAGSPYNGVPTLTEWTTSAWPAFEFRVNNVVKPTVPTDISTWTPGAAAPLVLAGPGNPSYLGGVAEILYYSAGFTAAQRTKAIDYMVSRYPSAPIVP